MRRDFERLDAQVLENVQQYEIGRGLDRYGLAGMYDGAKAQVQGLDATVGNDDVAGLQVATHLERTARNRLSQCVGAFRDRIGRHQVRFAAGDRRDQARKSGGWKPFRLRQCGTQQHKRDHRRCEGALAHRLVFPECPNAFPTLVYLRQRDLSLPAG